jgi:N-acetyl-anhydromuramyl-L-alanine amidase AmpD
MNIVNNLLPANQYIKHRMQEVRQIVLHHTQGGTAEGAIEWWKQNTDKVGTNYIIEKDGIIIRTIPESSWAYGLGISSSSNNVADVFKTVKYSKNIEMMGISIELVSCGELILKDGKYFFEGGNRFISKNDVVKLTSEHRNCLYFDKYTDAQIESLKWLILRLSKMYNIPFRKDYSNIFDVNREALQGHRGIYTHVCYRSSDKTDLFPQPNLVTMLNSLINEV